MADETDRRGLPTSGTVVRGATPWAAPFLVLAATGWVLAVVSLLWVAQAGDGARATGIGLAAVTAVVGTAAGWLRRGCRVVVRAGEVLDQVAYRTVHRLPQRSIRSVHVTAGAWRWFVVELEDGTEVTLAGAGPLQFPAQLFDREGRSDLSQIDLLMGPDPTPGDS